MYLFFDTSANGEPKDWKAPINNPFNWPRMTHLSWLVYNEDRELINSGNELIKPRGFTITESTEEKHKISQQMAEETGINIKEALTPFAEALKEAQFIISFNQTFNNGVVGAELYRYIKRFMVQNMTILVKHKGMSQLLHFHSFIY